MNLFDTKVFESAYHKSRGGRGIFVFFSCHPGRPYIVGASGDGSGLKYRQVAHAPPSILSSFFARKQQRPLAYCERKIDRRRSPPWSKNGKVFLFFFYFCAILHIRHMCCSKITKHG